MADKTFADKVNEVVEKLVEKDGVWEFPADVTNIPEEVAYAAKLEKRARDNRNAFNESNKKVIALQTTNEKLTTHIVDNATLHLSKEQHDELDELKLTDPEAWRAKLNEHEGAARKILAEKVTEFTSAGKQMSELEERKIKLSTFKETTGIELSDTIIENQLPASYSKQLAEGKITFDEFLTKSHAFLTKDKAILGASEKDPETKIDLGKLPGGAAPDTEAQTGDLIKQYEKTIF